MVASQTIFGSVLSLFSLLEEFQQDWFKFFLICLVEFTYEAIWSWTSICREILGFCIFNRFYFTFSDQSVQIIWLYTLGWIYFEQLVSPFLKSASNPGKISLNFFSDGVPLHFCLFISALPFWSFSYLGYPTSWTSLPIIFSLLFPPCFPIDFLNWIVQFFYQVFTSVIFLISNSLSLLSQCSFS